MRLPAPGGEWSPAGVGEVDWIPFALLPSKWYCQTAPRPLWWELFCFLFYSNDSVFWSCNLTAENPCVECQRKILLFAVRNAAFLNALWISGLGLLQAEEEFWFKIFEKSHKAVLIWILPLRSVTVPYQFRILSCRATCSLGPKIKQEKSPFTLAKQTRRLMEASIKACLEIKDSHLMMGQMFTGRKVERFKLPSLRIRCCWPIFLLPVEGHRFSSLESRCNFC